MGMKITPSRHCKFFKKAGNSNRPKGMFMKCSKSWIFFLIGVDKRSHVNLVENDNLIC